MSPNERTAYERWVARNPNRYGSALMNAYLDGYRTRAAEHLDACPDGCDECADERVFGDCSSCGGVTEAVGPDELSRCCGSRVVLTSPENDDRRAA